MVEFTVNVEIPNNSDEEKTAQLTTRLRSELAELPIESIKQVKIGATPKGSRSAAEAISWSALAVTLGRPALPYLFKLLQSWVARQPTEPKVTVSIGRAKLVIEGNHTIGQEKAIQAFLAGINEKPHGKAGSQKPTN